MRRTGPQQQACIDAYDLLLRSARQLVRGDEHGAEDLVQEVILRALSSPSSIEAPGKWSRTVLRNLARTEWARTGRYPEHLDSATTPLEEAGEAVEARENTPDVRRIRHELERLPECFRLPIEWTYLRGLSLGETSSRLGVPYRTVLSRRRRGLAKIRDALNAGQSLDTFDSP